MSCSQWPFPCVAQCLETKRLSVNTDCRWENLQFFLLLIFLGVIRFLYSKQFQVAVFLFRNRYIEKKLACYLLTGKFTLKNLSSAIFNNVHTYMHTHTHIYIFLINFRLFLVSDIFFRISTCLVAESTCCLTNIHSQALLLHLQSPYIIWSSNVPS